MDTPVQIAGAGSFLPIVFHPGAANQQPVGIDADGRAGDQSAKILPFDDFQRLHLIRLHHQHLIHLISQHFIENVQIKPIPQLQLVQIGKQLRFRHTPVAGQSTMGAFAAQGITGFRQMADSVGKDVVAGALINRQVHINFGNGDITKGIAKLD